MLFAAERLLRVVGDRANSVDVIANRTEAEELGQDLLIHEVPVFGDLVDRLLYIDVGVQHGRALLPWKFAIKRLLQAKQIVSVLSI